MKESNEEALIFSVPASNHFKFWCRSCDEMMSCMPSPDLPLREIRNPVRNACRKIDELNM